MSTNLNLNLHFYDGKIQDIINEIQRHTVPQITSQEFEYTSKEIMLISKQAGTMFNLLVSDIGKGPNNDTTNRIRVDGILPFCISLWQTGDKDFRSIMILQLEDLATGTCPQGRAVRCVQMIWPFMNRLR